MTNDFHATMTETGLTPPLDILPGKWTRFPGIGKKNGNKAGYAFLFPDGLVGIYGDFSCGLRETWKADKVSSFTPAEKIKFEKLIKQKQAEAEKEQKEKWSTAAKEAKAFISTCKSAKVQHPYLIKKTIPIAGALQHEDKLIIPIYQSSGKLVGYQSIDKNGKKLYNKGIEKVGACAVINGDDNKVCICEGFSTGASIYSATGYKVLIAMDAGNMIHVAREAVKKYNNILICADNDHKTEAEGKGNAGLKAVKGIQKELGLPYVYPEGIEGSDFNDLQSEQGADAVTAIVMKGYMVKPYIKAKGNSEYPDEALNPPGLLKDIADYYNKTAICPQPLFGVAVGLIVGSVVLGRRYRTNFNNYTSLYMMIVAKSGTGKDHVKQVVREILKGSGLEWLERSEGFTSANTVIKALENQPLQVSFFEEMGLKLQEATTGSRSLARGAFRKLLDIFSSCHSFSVSEEYADGSVHRVNRPALTMVGLSTPRMLTEAINEELIEQGFVNRILPFISSKERAPYPFTMNPALVVPSHITEWIEKTFPKGNLAEAGVPVMPEEDDEVIIHFSSEATALLTEINKEVIEWSNQLEKWRLDDMLGRTLEISMRIALIAAVMDGKAEIGAEYVRWAWGLVRGLYGLYVDEIRRHVAGSDYEKAKLKALESLRMAGEKGVSPRTMPKVSPWSQWPKKLRDEILIDLKDSGLADITQVKTGKRGPKTMVWLAIE